MMSKDSESVCAKSMSLSVRLFVPVFSMTIEPMVWTPTSPSCGKLLVMTMSVMSWLEQAGRRRAAGASASAVSAAAAGACGCVMGGGLAGMWIERVRRCCADGCRAEGVLCVPVG